MKKMLCLCLCLVLLLSACGKNSEREPQTEVTLYYCHSESDRIEAYCSEIMAPEIRRVHLHPDDVAGLLEEYFKGPSESSGLETMVPPGVKLLDWSIDDEEVLLVLNDAMNDLTAIRLRTAAACIARTVGAFLHVNTLRLRFGSSSPDNELLIDLDRLVLEDYAIHITGLPVKLHYLSRNGQYLIEEEQNITATDFSDAVKEIIQALCHDPASGKGSSALPSGTQFLNAEVNKDSNICQLNLSADFLVNRFGDEIKDRLCLFSIVNSLTQLDDVDTVQININGSRISPDEWPDASRPLEYDERFLRKTDRSLRYYDATLYVYREGESVPVPFPVQLPKPDENRAQSVVYSLTCFHPKNGYYSPLYKEEMPDCVLEKGVVTVTLSPSLLENHADDRKLLLRSIQDSLKSLPRVREVRFFSGGKSISP